MRLLNLNILIVFLTLYSFGQNRDSTQIKILPKWEINDTQKLKIKVFEKEIINAKSTKTSILYNCSFKVLKKDESGYLLSWIFNDSKVIEGKLDTNQIVLSKLLSKEILIKFTNYGQYIEIDNYKDIGIIATKIIDDCILKSTNKEEKINFKITKELISTKEGVETTLLKFIKAYFLPFGHQYPLNLEMTYNLKYPNVFGGNEPYDALERVCLTMPESKNNSCIIESNQVINTKQLLKDMISILKNELNYKDTDIETYTRKYKVGLTEDKVYYVDLNKGVVQKITLKRLIDMKILRRFIKYEYEVVN